RGRELGLLQDLAGTREPAARPEDARRHVVEARAAVDKAFGETVAHREALIRVLDRGIEQALETEPPLIAREVAPRGDHARYRREKGAFGRIAVREALHIERRGCRAGTVVRGDLARSCVVYEREQVAADGCAVGLRHGAHRGRRDGRIDGVTALAKDAEPGG